MAQDEDPGTVLVTGAGRRLGRIIALDFANRGWRVGIHYHASAVEALALVAEIDGKGGKAAAFAADLGHLEALQPLIGACAKTFGPPTCLINNAARFAWDSLATLDGERWQAHLDVNLRALIFLTQALVKALPEGSSGDVINLLDQKALRPGPEYFSYTIAKAALWTATQNMAQALAPRIRVNAIAPGPVLKSQGQSQAAFEQECRATLLRRAVDAEDVTAAIRFLLDTPSITGQMIALDAGQHLAWPGKMTSGDWKTPLAGP
ncbi:MAG: SDR family oxidoreductase [Methyloceanibacter sp.]|uniref:SDR family oxidoreductase n=1 Tax=Methyloceanibacter sp. TaxID=1965321 RepID=UPI003D9ABF2F